MAVGGQLTDTSSSRAMSWDVRLTSSLAGFEPVLHLLVGPHHWALLCLQSTHFMELLAQERARVGRTARVNSALFSLAQFQGSAVLRLRYNSALWLAESQKELDFTKLAHAHLVLV